MITISSYVFLAREISENGTPCIITDRSLRSCLQVLEQIKTVIENRNQLASATSPDTSSIVHVSIQRSIDPPKREFVRAFLASSPIILGLLLTRSFLRAFTLDKFFRDHH